MGFKPIKVSDDFYARAERMASEQGISLGKAIETMAGREIPNNDKLGKLVESCAKDAGLEMPADPAWLDRMLQLIPAGISPKLDRYRGVYMCAVGKLELAEEAEANLPTEPISAVVED